MSLIDDLVQLSLIDAQLRGLRTRLRGAESHHGTQKRALDEARATVAELEANLRQRRARMASFETEIAGLDERIAKFREDLNNSVNQKQYAAVLSEMASTKTEKSKLEEAVLGEMEHVERLDATLGEARTRVEELKQTETAARAKLDERRNEIASRLQELEGERAVAVTSIKDEHLRVFEEASHMHAGDALAAVEEIDRRGRAYCCAGCNISLPFDQVSLLTGDADRIVRCPACGRILHLEADLKAALVR